MAVPNSDSVPSEFFPGISSGLGSSAPGSAGNRTAPPDGAVPGGSSGVPGVGTVMPLDSQAGPGESASTAQPGQVSPSAITPGGPGLTDTGAGGGRARVDSSGRYEWQQPAGGQ